MCSGNQSSCRSGECHCSRKPCSSRSQQSQVSFYHLSPLRTIIHFYKKIYIYIFCIILLDFLSFSRWHIFAVIIHELSFCLSRNQLTADYLMSIESSEGLMDVIGTQVLSEGTYHSPEAVTQKINAVSSADVVNVSNCCLCLQC